MKIEAPCRIGQRFRSKKPWHGAGKFTLTGLGFFYWESKLFSGTTLYGKISPGNEQEATSYYDPKDSAEGVRISFELPDELFRPGYPLRRLGLNTDAVGWIGGMVMTEFGVEYYIYYGKSHGGPMKQLRTAELDKLFEPVLPMRAVSVDPMDYLI